MKRRYFIGILAILVTVLCIVTFGRSVAYAEGERNTITFHSGSEGFFDDDSDTYVFQYSDVITKESHSGNFLMGTWQGDYDNYLRLNDVVSIPQAPSLHIDIKYGTRYEGGEWACIWKGSHPEYTAADHFRSSFTGRLGGYNEYTNPLSAEYDVDDDTVTFGFFSQNYSYGCDYGYYATITGQPIYSEYKEPIPVSSNNMFAGWTLSADNSLELVTLDELLQMSGNIDVYAVYTCEQHTVTFHSGTEGMFDNDTDTNVVQYGEKKMPVRRYIHTDNIDDDGVVNGSYPRSSKSFVTTIDGASSLHLKLTYATFNEDYIRIWRGTTSGNQDASIVGKLSGGNHTDKQNTIERDVVGSSVYTYFYTSYNYTNSYFDDHPEYDLYGYYCVITGYFDPPSAISGTYKEPNGVVGVFAGWNTEPDGSGQMLSMNDLQMATVDMDVYAVYVADSHTITFHSGDSGQFSHGGDTNVVIYGAPIYDPKVVYSHTPNIDDNGAAAGTYGNSLNLADVVSIPGASSLRVTLKYTTEPYDYVCLWEGAHSDYTVASNYGASLTGLLYGGASSGTAYTRVYTVSGDSVTIGFKSDNTYYASAQYERYGYYAIIEDAGDVTDGTYEDPVSNDVAYRFIGWNTESDGSGDFYENVASIFEDMDLYAVYDENISMCGVYRNVDWRIRSDGCLILGNVNEVQTYYYKAVETERSWPWAYFRDDIHSVQFDNTVIGSSSLGYMFYHTHITDIDFTSFDLHDVFDAQYMFSCTDMPSVDLSSCDLSGVVDMTRMFYYCQSLTDANLSNVDLSNATILAGLFRSCENLVSVDFTNTRFGQLTNVQELFYGCTSLPYLDVSMFDFSKVQIASGIYTDCSSLTRFKFGENNPVLCADDAVLMLPMDWSYALEDSDPVVGPYDSQVLAENYDASISGYWSKVEVATGTTYAVFDSSDNTLYFLQTNDDIVVPSDDVQIIHSLDGTEVSGIVYAVVENTGRTETENLWGSVADVVEHVVVLDKVSLSDDVSGWFADFNACTTMDVVKLDVFHASSLKEMFLNCSSLEELDLSRWDSTCTDVSSMFSGCSSLKSLNLHSFSFRSTGSRTNALFKDCSALEELDIIGNQTSCIMDFSPLVRLRRVNLGLYPTYNMAFPGAPGVWTREDGAYGPYDASYFEYQYNYLSTSSSVEYKIRAGWYVRDKGVCALLSSDDNTLYFFYTYDTCPNSGMSATLRCESNGQLYTGACFYLPRRDESVTNTPSWYTAGSNGRIEHVRFLDEISPLNNSLYYWFIGCKDIDVTNLNTTGVVNLDHTFQNAKADKLDLTGWDVSSVTSMDQTFYDAECTDLDLTGWDVRNVRKLNYTFRMKGGNITAPDMHWDNWSDGSSDTMFGYMQYGDLYIPRWTFGKRADMNGFFHGFHGGNIYAPDWDLTGATTLRSTAYNSQSSGNFDFSGWHSDTVDNVEYFCSHMYSVKSLNLANVSFPNATHASGFVYYCEGLRELNVDNLDLSGAIDASSLFCYASKVRSLDVSTMKLDSAVDMSSMFSGCHVLESLTLPAWDTSHVTNMRYLFAYCDALKYLDISEITIPSNATTDDMFYQDVALQSLSVNSSFKLKSSQSLVRIPNSAVQYHWVDDYGTYGPFSTSELIEEYPSGFNGTWLWDLPDPRYYIKFDAPDGTVGSMAMVTVGSAAESFSLPVNKYRRPGATFLYWRDNILNMTFNDGAVISANVYSPGDMVVLTAVFNGDGGEAVDMSDGGFTFKLKKDQMAVFDNLPVNIKYQVYEDTPYGWTLVADSNTSGSIEAEARAEAGFGNVYTGDQCAVILSGSKFLDNRLADQNEFQFELIDENGIVVDTTTTKAGGNIVFDTLTFTSADVGREIFYTVREVLPTDDTLIYSSLNDNATYDTHEERIKIIVSYELQGDGALYSHTDNLMDDGSRVPASVSVPAYHIYQHSNNMDDEKERDLVGLRDDGTVRGDYESNTPYAAVLNVRNAVKMHVKITYSNPRGSDGLFAVWLGSHNEVRSGVWTDECNLNNTYHVYSGESDGVLHTDEFDVVGNEISLRYVSEALAIDDPNYTEYSNFGYHVEITVDETYLNGAKRSDGSYIDEFVGGKDYTDVISIPGADQLHVELSYSAPRGTFLIWDGSHPEVPTYDEDFNETTASHNYSSDEQHVLLTDEFDVNGDALTVLYNSSYVPVSDPDHTEYSNYGYYMKVTPVSLSGDIGRVPFSVSTPNVDKSGIQQGDYVAGKDYVDVISIPGATVLNLRVKYNMGSNDRLRIFEGSHPEYTDSSPFTSIATLTGSSDEAVYTINADSATLVFHAAENSEGGNGYGYYATYTSNNDLSKLVAEVIYDDDGIDFRNKSLPSELHLSKNSSANQFANGDVSFAYEVSFVTENGQVLGDDVISELSYYAEDEAIACSNVKINHILQKYDDTEELLYVDSRNNLTVGDQFVVSALNFYATEYDHNDYSSDSRFVATVADANMVVNVYYKQLPFTMSVSHILVDDSGQELEVLATELRDEYEATAFTIDPLVRDDCMYVGSNWPVITDSAIHGTMLKRDIDVKLYYKAVRTVTFSRVGNNVTKTVQIALPSSFKGLKTGQYGDVEFVDGIGTFELSAGDADGVVLRLPKEAIQLSMKYPSGDYMDQFELRRGSSLVASYNCLADWTYSLNVNDDYDVDFLCSAIILEHDASVADNSYVVDIGYSSVLPYGKNRFGGRLIDYGDINVTVHAGESVVVEIPYSVASVSVQNSSSGQMPFMTLYADETRTSVVDYGRFRTYKVNSAGVGSFIMRFPAEGTYHFEQGTVTKYSHTSNIDDNGVWQDRYSSYLSYIDTVSIPGATSLQITITYEMYDSDDWACIWYDGNSHFAYSSEYSTSNTGRLRAYSKTTATYTANSSVVTFGFCSDYSPYYSTAYGYYAVITGEGDILVYNDP